MPHLCTSYHPPTQASQAPLNVCNSSTQLEVTPPWSSTPACHVCPPWRISTQGQQVWYWRKYDTSDFIKYWLGFVHNLFLDNSFKSIFLTQFFEEQNNFFLWKNLFYKIVVLEFDNVLLLGFRLITALVNQANHLRMKSCY